MFQLAHVLMPALLDSDIVEPALLREERSAEVLVLFICLVPLLYERGMVRYAELLADVLPLDGRLAAGIWSG